MTPLLLTGTGILVELYNFDCLIGTSFENLRKKLVACLAPSRVNMPVQFGQQLVT